MRNFTSNTNNLDCVHAFRSTIICMRNIYRDKKHPLDFVGLELVGLKWRGFVGALSAETYAVGYLLLALIGYFCRERKTLHIVTTMTLIIFVPVIWSELSMKKENTQNTQKPYSFICACEYIYTVNVESAVYIFAHFAQGIRCAKV